MAASVVDVIAFLQEHKQIQEVVLHALGIDQESNPFDVPIHEFTPRKARLTVQADPEDPASVEQAVELTAAQATNAAIGQDAEGQLFLIRKGDWVLRSDTTGAYSLLKTQQGTR